eukprot:scaffold305295_cov14-Tisochrysis_lutea.AAC.1
MEEAIGHPLKRRNLASSENSSLEPRSHTSHHEPVLHTIALFRKPLSAEISQSSKSFACGISLT